MPQCSGKPVDHRSTPTSTSRSPGRGRSSSRWRRPRSTTSTWRGPPARSTWGHHRCPRCSGSDGVGRLPDGRRVFVDSAVVPFGTWAERALAGTDSLLDVADGVDDATAAALANTGLTAWLALCWRAPVQPGQTVLVLGSAGAVGTVAAQAAQVLGAGRVIAAVLEGERPPPGARRGRDADPGGGLGGRLPRGVRRARRGSHHRPAVGRAGRGRAPRPPPRARGWCRSAPWPARRCSCRRRSCGRTTWTSWGTPCSTRRSRSGGTPTGS